MTTLAPNGHVQQASTGCDCIITEISQTTKRSWREAGFIYARFKRKSDPFSQANLGFCFWPGIDAAFDLDIGFEFLEHEFLEYNTTFGCTWIKPEFYPEDFQVPRIAAARLSSNNIRPATPQVQAFTVPAVPAQAPIVEQPAISPLVDRFAADISALYNHIRKSTQAGPQECQRMATSAFIALRQAEDKLTPEQVDQLRGGSY